MQASRILPDLQASILCEDVRQEVTGNFILLGVIGAINVPQLPVTALKLCVFNRWTAGIGVFTETVRLMAPDGTTVVRQSQGKFNLTEPGQSHTNVTIFGQVKFDLEGVYHIEVSVDNVLKLRYPLPLRVVQQPGAPGQQRPTETQ